MKLHYFKAPNGNFGDDLNEWLWSHLLPKWRESSPDIILVGVGSILNEKQLRPFRNDRILILGAGVGYGGGPPKQPLPKNWDFRAVRGPLSASILGLPSTLAILDPAMMVPELPEFRADQIIPGSCPIFVPHHTSVHRHNWKAACAEAGLEYVSPELDSSYVIKKIAGARIVLAEAMHAAIVADSFRVPWIPVKIGERFNYFKWHDWAGSLNILPKIPPFFPILNELGAALSLSRGRRMQERIRSVVERPILVRGLIRNLRREAYLSADSTLEKKKQRFLSVLEDVSKEYCP